MLDFYEKKDYDQNDLIGLIQIQAEESTHIDFKSGGSLEKSDKKKVEIGKDVSAFANADGGIIVYGMKEENHVASEISYIDGNNITKEWLENVINTQISPRIEGIHIHPVRFDKKIDQTVYIVKIPASTRVPHMSSDKRYYRRYNFQSVPMEDYEVRNLFQKVHKSELEIMEVLIETNGGGLLAQTTLQYARYKLSFQIKNTSNSIEHDYKLEVHFPKGVVSDSHNDIKTAHIRDENEYSVFSFGNKTPLFQQELTTVQSFEIRLDPHNFSLLKKPLICILYYSNGKKERIFDLAPILTYQNRSLHNWGWH
ncbi:ATP-binding protein [Pedobacter nutrimenti]|uniref:AlbA family DNA-binding domain-containing protein n=1 Tax=Pedobacter nutrimenti TaxID=1241337 RepID=UPI00293041DD|nr:ATP-binding protein [Pedobacter nutrimenti]